MGKRITPSVYFLNKNTETWGQEWLKEEALET